MYTTYLFLICLLFLYLGSLGNVDHCLTPSSHNLLGVIYYKCIFPITTMSGLAESSPAGPSTPSRKRSRWDVDDSIAPSSLDSQHHPTKRGRGKVRAQTPPVEPHSVRTLPRQATTERNRPSHSIYVPPRTNHPPLAPSRSVYCYERLNSIEEGSYGVVFRARDKETGDIVALKKLKLEEEKHGFPITALREINALIVCKHENVVGIREIVVGDTLTQCVNLFVT